MSTAVSEEDRAKMLKQLSRLVAETIGKPEQYVMVTVSHSDLLMSGQLGKAAFVDLRSIGGLSGEVNRKLTAGICQILDDVAGIPANAVYVTFMDVRASHWGWNRATFG